MLYLSTHWQGPNLESSIHWNLFSPRIVLWEADAVRLALCGDIDAMKREFFTKRSTPFDQLPDGSTLLHVRLEIYSKICSS